MRSAIVFFGLLLRAASSLAQLGDYREQEILLPIHVDPTHGNFGSRWISELWLRNGTDRRLYIFPLTYSDWFVFPGETQMPPVWRRPVGSPPGQLLLITSTDPDRIRFNLRVRDTSRQSESWGTELPAVRESEFRRERIVLLNIPADDRYRRVLRIYQPLPRGHIGGDVVIRILGIPDDQLLWEQRMTLKGRGNPYISAYLEVPLNSQIAGVARARVEIVPLYPWMKIWAFISVTNNETQQVTTVTPQ